MEKKLIQLSILYGSFTSTLIIIIFIWSCNFEFLHKININTININEFSIKSIMSIILILINIISIISIFKKKNNIL
jgi:hypothetical protein